jgi:hypothetical protein
MREQEQEATFEGKEPHAEDLVVEPGTESKPGSLQALPLTCRRRSVSCNE